AFLMRGNVVDLTVAVVIGAAFGAIVMSFVKDILMPPIGLVLGRVNFDDLFVTLSGASYPSLAAAKAAGAPTLNYGAFINTIINFVIVGSAVFLLVRVIDRLHARPLPPSPSTKECPQCAMVIPVRAVRCPHCTSNVGGAQGAPPPPPPPLALPEAVADHRFSSRARPRPAGPGMRPAVPRGARVCEWAIVSLR